MGKGIPAGLLMTMLRGMLRAEVLTGLPPDRILHDLNQLAIDDLDQSHRFVTLFIQIMTPELESEICKCSTEILLCFGKVRRKL